MLMSQLRSLLAIVQVAVRSGVFVTPFNASLLHFSFTSHVCHKIDVVEGRPARFSDSMDMT